MEIYINATPAKNNNVSLWIILFIWTILRWDLLPLIWIANQFISTSTCPYIVSRKYHLAQFYALQIWSGWKMLWKCFYLNCLGFEATGKPGRYLAFLGKLQIFQMVSIFIEHFKERNSKLNFPNLHVAEKLFSHQPSNHVCMHSAITFVKLKARGQGDQWLRRWECLIWLISCHNLPDHLPLTCRSMLEHCHQPILTSLSLLRQPYTVKRPWNSVLVPWRFADLINSAHII